MVIALEDMSKPNENGYRDLTFSVNGNRRVISIKDKQALTNAVISGSNIQYAKGDDPSEIGANIPGTIIKVLVNKGDAVKKGEAVAVIEAMKMETNVISPKDGVIEKVFVKEGESVKSGQLVAVLEAEEE